MLGVLACKLLQTVVSLMRGRDQYVGVQDQLTLVNREIVDSIEPVLLDAVQRDSDQFNRLILARQARDAEPDPEKRRPLRERALAEQRPA